MSHGCMPRKLWTEKLSIQQSLKEVANDYRGYVEYNQKDENATF